MEVGTPRGGTTRAGNNKCSFARNFLVYFRHQSLTTGLFKRLKREWMLASDRRSDALALKLKIVEENVIGLTTPTDSHRVIVESGTAQIKFRAFWKTGHQPELDRRTLCSRQNRDGRYAAAERVSPLKRSLQIRRGNIYKHRYRHTNLLHNCLECTKNPQY